jgi:hypothetical protein
MAIAAAGLAAALAAGQSTGLSGTGPSDAAAKAKYLPPALASPNGFCRTRTVRAAYGFAPRRRFTVYEVSGDARGPHFWWGAASAKGYDCVDGRTQVAWDFIYDLRQIRGTTITGQFHARRVNGAARASSVFELKPGWVHLCCWEARYLPTVTFGGPASRLLNWDITPLENLKKAYPWSAVDTKGGLKTNFRY